MEVKYHGENPNAELFKRCDTAFRHGDLDPVRSLIDFDSVRR
jgi:hypothetical protein